MITEPGRIEGREPAAPGQSNRGQSTAWSTGDRSPATEQRRVARLYLLAVTLFFLAGGSLALLMRAETATAQSTLLSSDLYNRLFTIHGLIMVYLFVLPALPGVLGNLLIPTMVGAREPAFPRLNRIGAYAYVLGGVLLLTAAVRGGVDVTWTFSPGVSAARETGNLYYVVGGVAAASIAVTILSLNFLVTIHKLRAPGLSWNRLPIFVWSQYCSSGIILLATPILWALLLLVVLQYYWGTGGLDPRLGGDPLLFKRLFWLYARPVLYAAILPALGVVTEVFTASARRPVIVGYRWVVGSLVAISVLGCLAAGGHFFSTPQSIGLGLFASGVDFLLAVPFTLLIAHWLLTLFRGSLEMRAPLLYALGFLGLLLIGGLSGLILAAAGLNLPLHGTLFVVAHFHYLLAGCLITAYLGGLHFWWREAVGRDYPEGAAKLAAALLFVGLNLTFLPLLMLGSLGMPRRTASYPAEFEPLNLLATAGALVLAAGYLLPMIYLLWSARRRPIPSGIVDDSLETTHLRA